MPHQHLPGADPSSGYPPIGDYGAIGDCRTLALVSRRASIDWWCQPRFDSPSLFARLIDWQRGGGLWIEAEGLRPAGRRYLGATAVLETRLETKQGALTVTDFLALVGEEAPGAAPRPYARQKLVRLLRIDRGRIDLRVRCQPRPDFARRPPGLRPLDAGTPNASTPANVHGVPPRDAMRRKNPRCPSSASEHMLQPRVSPSEKTSPAHENAVPRRWPPDLTARTAGLPIPRNVAKAAAVGMMWRTVVPCTKESAYATRSNHLSGHRRTHPDRRTNGGTRGSGQGQPPHSVSRVWSRPRVDAC